MTVYQILINILVFSGIALLLAITVAVIQGIIILIDVRRTTKQVTTQIKALTSVIDIVSLVFGGLGGAKKVFKKKLKNQDKSTLIASIAGIKRGLQVLLRRDK